MRPVVEASPLFSSFTLPPRYLCSFVYLLVCSLPLLFSQLLLTLASSRVYLLQLKTIIILPLRGLGWPVVPALARPSVE